MTRSTVLDKALYARYFSPLGGGGQRMIQVIAADWQIVGEHVDADD